MLHSEEQGARQTGRGNLLCRSGAGEVDGIAHDDADDDAEKADSAPEDFNDENFHEKGGVLGIRKGAGASNDTDAHATGKIAETGREPSIEDGIG